MNFLSFSSFFSVLISFSNYAQQKKVEISNSPKAVVIIGNGNTIKNVIVNTPLSITLNPETRSVEMGKGCSFKAKATGGAKPYKYRWFVNGIITVGAIGDSLVINNLGLKYHYARITVMVTDSRSSIINSKEAIIKLIQPYYIGYSIKDPFINDTTIPEMENIYTDYLYHDSSISFYLPKESEQAFWILKVPSNEPIKTDWYHNDINYGDIPDLLTRKPFIIGNYTYYVSRNEFSFNPRQPMVLQKSKEHK